jgi:uncharacterized membrane protein
MRFIFFVSVILLITACNNNTKKESIKRTDTVADHKSIASIEQDTIFTGLGTEPFWAVYVIRDSKIVFEPADGPIFEMELTRTDTTSPGITRYIANNIVTGIFLTVKKENCSDGMSEEIYPFSVDLVVEGKKYNGCGRKKDRMELPLK